MELVAYYLSKVVLFLDYCLCFDLQSSLIKPPSTLQTFFTFTLLPTATLFCTHSQFSECCPVPVVSALPLTTLQPLGIKSLSVPHAASDSSVNFSFKNRSLFQNLFFSPIVWDTSLCVSVCIYACVRACVRACLCVI